MKQCFLCIFLTACGFAYRLPPYVEHAHVLAARCASQYQTENQLMQECSGGGIVDGVNSIDCWFVGYRKIGIEEGRRLFVEGIESFCAAFNNDLIIRPYLHNYPFDVKNIDLVLTFRDPITFQIVSSPYISFISCKNNTLLYSVYDSETEKYCIHYKEPYAEAVRIVHEEREAARNSSHIL